MKCRLLSYAAVSAIALVALSNRLAGAEAAPTNGWECEFAPVYVSQYMYRGTLLGGASLQPEFTVSRGDTSFGVWASVPAGSKLPDQTDLELDVTATQRWTLNERWAAETGVAIYTYPRADLNEGYYRVTIEPVVGISWTQGPLVITPRLYYDLMSQGPLAEIAVERSIEITKAVGASVSAAFGAFRLRDSLNRSESPTLNRGRYWSIGFNLSRTIGEHGSLSVGWTLTAGEGNDYEDAGERYANTAAVRRGVLSVSLARSW